MQLLHFRTTSATKVVTWLENVLSLSVLHTWKKLFMLGMKSILTVHSFCFTAPVLPELQLKALYYVPWDTLCLVTGSCGCTVWEGSGEVDVLVPTGVTVLQHQHCGFTTHGRWLCLSMRECKLVISFPKP